MSRGISNSWGGNPVQEFIRSQIHGCIGKRRSRQSSPGNFALADCLESPCGFDPRGVARSAPIKCLTNKETDAYYASIIETEKSAKAFADKCLSKNPNLKFMSTENVARDLDILRSALGERKLNFMGSSYGTYLGTLYLDLFPKKAGRLVLDGAIDPMVTGEAQIVDQAKGFDSLVSEYEKYSGSSVVDVFNGFKKIKNQDGRVLTESLAIYAVAAAITARMAGSPPPGSPASTTTPMC